MNIETYINELQKDTVVNELNLKEKSLCMPGLKAKWVSRLIQHKNAHLSLTSTKKKIIKEAIPLVKKSLPVKLTDSYIKNEVEELEEVVKISKKIEEEEKIIDFLEKVEKIMSSMSYDISNIIKIVQLETL